MVKILELPWIPLLSLTIVIPLIIWQIKVYIEDKQKNRTPKIPQINLQNQKNEPNDVKNVTLISALKAKNKTSKKISLFFTITVITFVVINVLIVTFYLNSRKISYLPRATDSTSPIPTKFDSLGKIDNAFTPTSTPTSHQVPTANITKSLEANNTPTPILILSPTRTLIVEPTLVAQAYSVPTYAPSPTQTPKPTQAPTMITQTIIPVVGVGQFSIVLGVLSLFFLILGLML